MKNSTSSLTLGHFEQAKNRRQIDNFQGYFFVGEVSPYAATPRCARVCGYPLVSNLLLCLASIARSAVSVSTPLGLKACHGDHPPALQPYAE